MIVAIVGDETVHLLQPYIVDWVNTRLDAIIDHIIATGGHIITGTNDGVEKLLYKKLQASKLPVILVSRNETLYPQADLIFYDPTEQFLLDFSDYIVIITNGQEHSRLKDLTKGDRTIINYLTGKKERIK